MVWNDDLQTFRVKIWNMVIPCYVFLLKQTYPHPLLPRFSLVFLLTGTGWKPPASTPGVHPHCSAQRACLHLLARTLPSEAACVLDFLIKAVTQRLKSLLFLSSDTALLLLTQSVPWLWDGLRSCLEKLDASFRVHHCRQIYTPQKMTGLLLDDPTASLTWRSAFMQFLVIVMDGS